jgi:hypothetical protein
VLVNDEYKAGLNPMDVPDTEVTSTICPRARVPDVFQPSTQVAAELTVPWIDTNEESFNSVITKYVPTEIPVADETTNEVDPAFAPEEMVVVTELGSHDTPLVPNKISPGTEPYDCRTVDVPIPRRVTLLGMLKLPLIRKVPAGNWTTWFAGH